MTLPNQTIDQTASNTAQFITHGLTRIFRDVFDDDEMVISEGTTALDVEGWDSLANIRIMVSVEKAFGIRFTAAEISNLKDVGALAELVLNKQSNA
jgi:acyl carrier protein